ncbi:hypothetical protein AJ80_09685 [Polytolypa hystricis UAMH7299]|uniref:Uncharacterized protein n=1 Tax=Polytolypa hystricis (strain UAMH7299) TaxID=1447883 RepID=A0A2B7WLN9_POLH7|nr:hypothetical protein AJ80_09685 [Polytolypa hystricis UAMH7299]
MTQPFHPPNSRAVSTVHIRPQETTGMFNSVLACPPCLDLVSTIISRERAVQDVIRRELHQTKLMLSNTRSQHDTLQKSLDRLKHYCHELELALNEARSLQYAVNKDLALEKKEHAASHEQYNVLFAENKTLWDIFNEMDLVPAVPGTPPTVMELYHNNHEQQQTIDELQAEVMEQELKIRHMQSALDASDSGTPTEIIDDGEDLCDDCTKAKESNSQVQGQAATESKDVSQLLPSLMY